MPSATSEMDPFRTLNLPTPVFLDAAGRMTGGVSFAAFTKSTLIARSAVGRGEAQQAAWAGAGFLSHQSNGSPRICKATFQSFVARLTPA